jgi:hypothetical protein
MSVLDVIFDKKTERLAHMMLFQQGGGRHGPGKRGRK